MAAAYTGRGIAYYNKGDYDRAIADLDWAINLNPRLAEAHGSRGNAYFYKRNYDIAIAAYDKAIQLKPDFVEAYFGRGLAEEAQGDTASALVDFREAMRLTQRVMHGTSSPSPGLMRSKGNSARVQYLDPSQRQ